MKIGFVLDPLDSLKARKDTSILLMRAAARAGSEVFAAAHDKIAVGEDAIPRLTARPLTLSDDDSAWRREGAAGEYRADFFDAIVVRKDPPFDREYLYLTHLLDRAQAAGALVVNAPAALRDYSEKLSIFRFAAHIPPTLVARDPEALAAFHRAHRGAVIKPLDGMGGREIFVAAAGDKNLRAILETVGRRGRRTLLAQQYLPQIKDGDMRVVVVGGRPAPFMLARFARDDDHRANLDAGGAARAVPLGEAERRVAEDIGPTLAAAGILFAGLDLIGGKLTEINVTSPTGLREILDQTGCDCAQMVIDEIRRVRSEAPKSEAVF